MPEADDRAAQVRSAFASAPSSHGDIYAQLPSAQDRKNCAQHCRGWRTTPRHHTPSVSHPRALACSSQVRAQLKARLQSQDSVFEPQGAPPPLYKPELIEPKKKLTILQHCYKEPWIPIGALTTVSVLCVGFGAFVSGNKKLAQNMMRARVAAQGMTILSMFTATYFIATKPAEAHAEAAR